MSRLAEKAGKVDRRPYIPMLAEDNIRRGFFEPDQFRAVVGQLPADLQPVFEVPYITGWRVRSEILTRQWHHVDFDAGWLRLEPGETKNREGRMFPLTPELRAVLERVRAARRSSGCHGRWGRASFTSREISLREVCESRERRGSASPRGGGEKSGRSDGAARRGHRPVVPVGSRPAAGRYSLSSGAPCTSRG